MSISDPWNVIKAWLNELIQQAQSIDPTQRVVLWIQLLAGSLTVIWIIFQFAWLRRLNEARLERYLEDRIANERDDLARERAEVLLKIDRFSKARGISRTVLLAWANFRLVVSLVLRVLSLGTARGLTDHTSLLMQVGLLHRARSIHTEVAKDAIRKMKLYQEAVSNKRTEAQNALLFAGRIAVLEGRPVAAVAAFKAAKSLKDDPDARLLIGRQLAAASDLDGALVEYTTALQHTSITEKPATAAELHRATAEVLIKRNMLGTARTELKQARALDEPLRDYFGLGKTHELLGDLWAPRPRNRNAAATAYEAAIENFAHANQHRDERRVSRKLRILRGTPAGNGDGLITRALDKLARQVLKAVEKLRARAQRKED